MGSYRIDDFSEVQFHSLRDCLVRVVNTDRLEVDLFILRVATRKVRKVMKEIDRCV